MEIFRELFLRGDPVRLIATMDRIEDSLTDGWSREKATEQRMGTLAFKTYCFTAPKRGSRPAADVFLAEKDSETLHISNIVPRIEHRLADGQYNAILEEFCERYVRQAASRTGVRLELKETQIGKSRPLSITGIDLVQWADRKDTPGEMPRLIRRLIQETVKEVHRIGFPADEGVQLGGYDGIVQVQSGTPKVPEGQSVWEVSVKKNVKAKADEDYDKRKQDPLGLDPRETTFVFVTPRRWSGKYAWRKEHLEEHFWHEVRVIDADDLEEWLEDAPATESWLARLIGKRTDDMHDLDEVWALWSNRTIPAASPDLILAGRGREVEGLRQWLADPPSVQRLRAENIAEAIAFAAAVIKNSSPEIRASLLARTLVVASVSALHKVLSHRTPHIIIADFPSEGLPELALKAGHHVLLPVASDSPPGRQDLSLPPCSRQEVEDALQKMGIPIERARELARKCKGRLSVLARLLTPGRSVVTPTWAKPEEGLTLVPLLLAGAWVGDTRADRDILEKLAQGRPYAELESFAVRWALEQDPPLRQAGSVWQWISCDDAWNHLARFVTKDALDTFEKVVIEVLGMHDPRFDLPPEERWMASVKGKALPVSGMLRKGLAETLALLATRGDQTRDTFIGQNRADYLIRELLRDDATWQRWVSLAQLFPELAEAAPDSFLEAVQDRFLPNSSLVAAMFQQEGVMGGSPHTGLLWALETLAWEPQFLTRVAVILGRLSAIAPRGNLTNHPIESLREIFLTWIPHTCATLDQRFQAIDLLGDAQPGVAWELCLRLLPTGPDMSHNTRTPRWRDWHRGWIEGTTPKELQNSVNAVAERLLRWVGTDGNRWSQLIDAFPSLPIKRCAEAVRLLDALSRTSLSPEARSLIWEALRKQLHFLRSYPNSPRVLPKSSVSILDRIYRRLDPLDWQERVAWLFSTRPQLPNGTSHDWGKEQEIIENERLRVVKLVVKEQGPDALLTLAACVEEPGFLGGIVGKSDLTDDVLVPLLDVAVGNTDTKLARFGENCVFVRHRLKGLPWLKAFFAEGTGENWPPPKRAAFACGLPYTTATWDVVRSWGKEAENIYWKFVRCHFVDDPAQDGERAVSSLLQVGRTWAALDLAILLITGPRAVGLPTQLLLQILDAASKSDPKKEDRTPSTAFHGLDHIIEYLEKSGEVPEAQLATLEWVWLPLLEHSIRGIPLLHRLLGRDPEFFVTVLSFVYRSENASERSEEPDDKAQARATQAWRLLKEWQSIPGVAPDGNLDSQALTTWTDAARAACHAKGYAKIGDSQIGEILAYSPIGMDGAWPHEAVRNLIERVASGSLEKGLLIGVVNKRGVVTKIHDEGGKQERNLAAKYREYASAITTRFPRTAAVLRKIAAGYDTDARREDVRSELDEYV